MSSNGKLGASSLAAPLQRPLTPEERHHLLKSLVCAQMMDEWSLLDEQGGLQQYGPPFVDDKEETSHKKISGSREMHPEHCDESLILLHLFHAHLRRFPGLDTAKASYWRKQIVPFFDKVTKATFSNCQERSEYTNRKLLAFVATRYLATFWVRGIQVRGENEKKGPGRGEAGSEKWKVGKQWGKGTVKRGLEKPVRPDENDRQAITNLFSGGEKARYGDHDDDVEVWKVAGENVHRLKNDWSSWKESIIETENGLDKTLELLETKSIRNLPSEYRNATEWVRRHVAFVLWTVFVQYPGGDEILGIIKTIHALFPYWGAKQLLKIANAQKMIKAIIDLLLARPIGMVDSLGQRIFFIIMNSEISVINKHYLGPLRSSIKDNRLCDVLDTYVKSRTSEQRAKIMLDARTRNQDTLVSILEEFGYDDIETINDMQRDFLQSSFRSHLDWAYPAVSLAAKKMMTRPPEHVQKECSPRALKFAQLKLYLRERLRRRDREKVLEIGTGQLVPDIIKESLSIVFYSLIYQIALASDLSARLGDLQRFVDDMIQVKTQKQDELEDWIALCARHEDSLYIFVHEIRTAIKPVFDWCQEALDYMALSTTEPWNPSNRKASHVEINLDDLLQKAQKSSGSGDSGSRIDVSSIMQELDDLIHYSKWYKIDQELQMRKEFVEIRQDSITNVTKTPRGRAAPSADMKRELQDMPNLMKTLMEMQDVRYDDGIVRTTFRGTDIGELPWAYFGTDDIFHQHYDVEQDEADPLEYQTKDRVTTVPPTLAHIRTLLPLFRKHLEKRLPDWRSRAVC